MQLFYPLKTVKITQGFGVKSSLYKTSHPGIDLRAPENTPVYAAAAGKVIETKANPPYDGYGSHVTIEHGGGLFTVYAHLNEVICKLGDEVKLGQLLGLSGGNVVRFGGILKNKVVNGKLVQKAFRDSNGQFTRAGASTAPHLHFEKRLNGNSPAFAVNPLPDLLINSNLDMPLEFDATFVPDWAEPAMKKARAILAKKKDKDGKPLTIKEPNASMTANRLVVILDGLGLLG